MGRMTTDVGKSNEVPGKISHRFRFELKCRANKRKRNPFLFHNVNAV